MVVPPLCTFTSADRCVIMMDVDKACDLGDHCSHFLPTANIGFCHSVFDSHITVAVHLSTYVNKWTRHLSKEI